MYRVSVIHTKVARRFTVYMVQTRGVPVVVFVLLKNHFTESIIRQNGAEFEGKENVGENQNGDCSVFAHVFVGRSNQF